MKITNDLLKLLLTYNKETGKFYWRHRDRSMFQDRRSFSVWNSRFANKEAGSKAKNGYIYITMIGERYLAHRLAFLYVEGVFPENHVDHINLNRADNRFSNLRKCTMSQNLFNRNKNVFRKNGEKYKGVCLVREKYKAQIKTNGKNVYIGSYETEEQAAEAYNEYAKKLGGRFALLNDTALEFIEYEDRIASETGKTRSLTG